MSRALGSIDVRQQMYGIEEKCARAGERARRAMREARCLRPPAATHTNRRHRLNAATFARVGVNACARERARITTIASRRTLAFALSSSI